MTYLYHVAPHIALPAISVQGLVSSRGFIYLTNMAGLPFWFFDRTSRALDEQGIVERPYCCQVVLRVDASSAGCTDDETGNFFSLFSMASNSGFVEEYGEDRVEASRAYRCRPLNPKLLEVWTGEAWRPITGYKAVPDVRINVVVKQGVGYNEYLLPPEARSPNALLDNSPALC